MPRMPGPMRGAYLEAISNFAPILFGVLFLVVAVSLVRNWIDARRGTENQISPTQIDVRQLNSRGLVQVMNARSRDRER